MNKRNSAEEKLARFLTESAQQVWSAGLGALAVAEKEGSKLFETLSKLGETIETNTRKSAGSAGAKMAEARHSAGESWDKLEAMFEKRVARAMRSMNVPGTEDITLLSERIDQLAHKVDKMNKKLNAMKGADSKKPGSVKKKKKKKSGKNKSGGKQAGKR